MVISSIEPPTMVTSTSFKIKDLLLRAWRERWSEIEWGRNIKRLLCGVSGDVYDLADCMLRQAINGPVTNNLMMLYLNHCLDSQIISYGASIMAITKIPDLRPFCVNSLLDFLLRYKSRTNCFGNTDECLALCRALVSFLHWLHSISLSSLIELNENSSTNDQQTFLLNQHTSNKEQSGNFTKDNIHWQIIDKSTQMLSYIGKSSYLKSLLFIGRMEEPTVWKQWVQLHQQLISKLLTIKHSNDSLKTLVEPFLDSLNSFQSNMDLNPIQNSPEMPEENVIPVAINLMKTQLRYGYVPYRPLSFHSIRLLVSFYAILDPSCSNELLANYLAIMARTFDLTLPRLYCETLHACLVGLIDTHSLANEDPKNINYHSWIAFLLFKIPQVFLLVSQHQIKLRKENTETEKQSNKTDLELGIESLMEFGPCLDQFLLRYKTEHLHKLFDCFKEINLISAASVDRYMKEINHRMLPSSGDSTDFSRIDEHSNGGSSIQTNDGQTSNILIFQAKQTVMSILNTMETCKIETVAALICRMHQNFDIIICAVASCGILPKFGQRFIELNRTNIDYRGEDEEDKRNSQIRAVVFDITFIALCSLVERYGIEVLIDSDDSKNGSASFFSWWCQWNLPPQQARHAPDMIQNFYKEQPSKYDQLLQQLIVSNNSNQTEFKTTMVQWNQMCIAAQLATAQILQAWNHDVITTDIVKAFLERLKSKLCFLALSSACWLFAKLGTVSPKQQEKIKFMLQELMIPPPAQMNTSIELFTNDASESNLVFGYKYRFLLMSSILKRLFSRYFPSVPLNVTTVTTSNETTGFFQLSESPLNLLLEESLKKARNKLSLKLTHDLDGLISLGGPKWFVNQIIKILFHSQSDLASLQDSLDLAYGLFHLDLEQCAFVLLHYTLPEFLMSKRYEMSLIEPKVSALIRLTIITTYSAIEQMHKFRKLNMSRRCGHRRNYQEIVHWFPTDAEFLDQLLDHTPFYYKRREFGNTSRQNSFTVNEPMDVDGSAVEQKDEKSINLDDSDQWILTEPLYIGLTRLFEFVLEQSFQHEFSPWLLVPIALLEQILLNLREDAPKFLRFVSFSLLESIIQTPHCTALSFEQLLAYLVLDCARSRKIGAKLICQLQLLRQFVRDSSEQHDTIRKTGMLNAQPKS